MTRQRRGLSAALSLFGAAILVSACGLGAARPAAAGPYYLTPCTDSDGDRIEDYLTQVPDPFVDLIVVFKGAGWDPVATRAQVQHILDISYSSASIRYVGQWSPYVFLDHVGFGEEHQPPEELAAILALKDAVGARAYQRFILHTTIGGSGTPAPGPPVPIDEVSGEAPASTPPPAGGPVLVPGPIPIPIPVPGAPNLLIYVVDSGVDDTDAFWGIDAATQNPLAPKQARDPKDLTAIRHGTFVKRVALNTLAMASTTAPVGSYRHADVRVAVGPNGETTTLELARGFDAVVAHQIYERAHGHFYRAVVNVSYDTDGPIANHDIIYPGPGGLLGTRGAGAAVRPTDNGPGEQRGGGAPAGGAGPGVIPAPIDGNPCQVDLFDNVYKVLAVTYDDVVAVGAGNDGLLAAFVINELGLSLHVTTVVAALNPATGQPADYSCYGSTPGGYAQHGHPDLAAVGLGAAPGFAYQLQGTSIATAYTSGMAGAVLLQFPQLSPPELNDYLVANGSRLPDTGNRWYGAAGLHFPWEDRRGLPDTDNGPRAAAPPAARLMTGPGDRVAVQTELAGRVVVRLFSVTGRLVRTLQDGALSAGRHELAFDGRGEDGAPLPAGLYFVRGSSPGGSSVAKLLLRR